MKGATMTLQEKALERLARNQDKIVPWAEYGRHIQLKCKLHPEFQFNTKNLDYIGARTIFGSGCDCSISLLEPEVPADLDPRKIFLTFATDWIQVRKSRLEREAKLEKLGVSSAFEWIREQNKKTKKDLMTLKDEAHAMGIM
jgi:hypothetical protein